MKKYLRFQFLPNGRPVKLYLSLLVIILALFLTYFAFWRTKPSQTSRRYLEPSFRDFKMQEHPPLVNSRIVHIDLKGAPFKMSFYKSLFPLLVQLGATGVLIEYEDMFPYNTSLVKNISALNSYSFNDIKQLNKLALENRLDLIPLVQTFGHLEFLLKLEEFQDFREISEYPQVICPTHMQTIDLLIEMIEQVIELHPHSHYIHIGADEVYYLGFCDRCANFMNKFKLSRKQFYVEHVNTIARRIRTKYPNLIILMWDDEFRSFTYQDLNLIDSSILPVVWKYSKDVYEELGPSLWANYAKRFHKVWVGSAFKGATGSNQYINDISHYVQNHRSWLLLMSEYQNIIQFSGIIITGWQRYDHFGILTELLPVAIPSLAMSLRVIMGYKDSPLRPPVEVAKILGCEQPFALMGSAFGSPKCSYPGADILESVIKLQQLRQELETIMEDSRMRGWMSSYNRHHVFSSPQYVQSVTAPILRIQKELVQIRDDLVSTLNDVYDEFTINEFMETHVEPFERQIAELIESREKILQRHVWPRRPLQEL